MKLDCLELFERADAAQHEIDDLKVRVDEFVKDAVRIEVNQSRASRFGQQTLSELWLTQTKPVPVALRAKAGMIANELRAILDGLATCLAIRNGGSARSAYFPISRSEEIFANDGRRKISSWRPEDVTILELLRPFKGGNDLLFALHEADRTRKHQRLGSCLAGATRFDIPGVIAAEGDIELSVENVVLNGVRHGGIKLNTRSGLTEVGVPRLVGTVPSSLPYSVKTDIAYADPPELAGKPIVPTLRAFADLTRSVVGMFSE